MHGEAFLGAIPSPWKLRHWTSLKTSTWLTYYVDDSGQKTLEDPRLPPLPPGWEELRADDDSRPEFKQMTSGEVQDSDPRMSPEALKERGIILEEFRLV